MDAVDQSEPITVELPAAAVEAWRAAEPDGPGNFSLDRHRYSQFWRLGEQLLERLPKKSARSERQAQAADAIHRESAGLRASDFCGSTRQRSMRS